MKILCLKSTRCSSLQLLMLSSCVGFFLLAAQATTAAATAEECTAVSASSTADDAASSWCLEPSQDKDKDNDRYLLAEDPVDLVDLLTRSCAGAVVSEKIQVNTKQKQQKEDNQTTITAAAAGWTARENLAANEVLLTVPLDCIIHVKTHSKCELMTALADAVDKNNNGYWKYQLAAVANDEKALEPMLPSPPASWSQAAQDLLLQVNHMTTTTTTTTESKKGKALLWLPSVIDEAETCHYDKTKEQVALWTLVQGDAVRRIPATYNNNNDNNILWALVPLYDQMQRSTAVGKKVGMAAARANTRTDWFYHKDDNNTLFLQVLTTRWVPKGIALTWAAAADSNDHSSVTEHLSQTGQVVTFPQTWKIFISPQDNEEEKEEPDFISFTLDYKKKTPKTAAEEASIPPAKRALYLDYHVDQELAFRWIHKYKNWEAHDASLVDFLQAQVSRLYSMDTLSLSSNSTLLAIIDQYRRALILALESVLELWNGVGWCENQNGDNDKEDMEEEICFVPNTRYDPMAHIYDDYWRAACDEQAQVDFISENYEQIHQIESPYQDIVYVRNPDTGNICFELDSIYQICSSYRPHYHEMVVHYTARFLPKLTRVVFVGGGDSMLLHEIIKYPSVELVIGLELDQQVTRGAFHFFGAQPHYNLATAAGARSSNQAKVQWWYGDAAKSLLMLPAEYFETFDMVLVDLSETVMSALVTDGLDILTALSLLLKPEGVFVKNEMYFEKLNQIFPYSTQLKYDDVPLICKQCLAFGSFETNFLQTNLTDHHVEALFSPLERVDQDWQEVHDFHWNPHAKKYCISDKTDQQTQTASPGIILILEAEQADAQFLGSPQALREALVSALETLPVTVISSFTPSNNDQAVVILLKEGYIVAQAWVEFEYAALDIHLWSAFNQLEPIQDALLLALGSQESSALRIVAGGMFGVPNWKGDMVSRGPQYDPECSKPKKSSLAIEETGSIAVTDDADLLKIVLKENLDMWWPSAMADGTKINGVVICGLETEPCDALDLVRGKDFVSPLPVWTCPVLSSDSDLFSCEAHIVLLFEDTLKEVGGKICFVVMDANAPLPMAQVMRKIVQNTKLRRKLFTSEKDLKVFVPGSNRTNQHWRRVFASQFAPHFPEEPGYWSHVSYGMDDETAMVEMNLFISGDQYFATHLNAVNARIEQQTQGIKSTLGHLGGVEFGFFEDFEATQFFDHSDYDQQSPYEQWLLQQPIAYQTIFQLQVAKDAAKAQLSCQDIREMLNTAINKTNIVLTLEPQEFKNLGEGSVIVVAFSSNEVGGGIAVLTFDGRNHVDINLFTYGENEQFSTNFSSSFTAGGALAIVLRDEMPRGYGGVVNFASDLEEDDETRPVPYWAQHLE